MLAFQCDRLCDKKRAMIDPHDENECRSISVRWYDKLCVRRHESSFGFQTGFKAILRQELCQKNDELSDRAQPLYFPVQYLILVDQ
jgi:hypothetical protein